MVSKLIDKGKKIFTDPQSSILSAASIIMVMIVASRVLGLVRQRALAHFFTASELSLFFAAFRLPDLVFEVLVFGTFSSAFIPVFTKLLKKEEKDAWNLASTVVNIGLIAFIIIALVVAVSAGGLYKIFAPGFSVAERGQIVKLARILFTAQGFFVVSYVLTGVLESSRRFLLPALAPVFYNLGIILGTLFLSSDLHLMGPTLGVVAGAASHFMIQLPLAIKLGFRFTPKITIDSKVRKIGRLAAPRVLEVSFLQISKLVELFFASIISTASYTYYTFGNSLQLLPVGLFGTSIAKAALPTLARQSDDKKDFARTLWKSLHEMTFLIVPVATVLVVLRIPIVRLIYGTDLFSWEATVQTGMVVSAFAIGVVFQATNALLSRAFYALHDTKTPVLISISSIITIIILDYIFIKQLGFDVWGLAAAFSAGSFVQALTLFYLINKRLNGSFSFSYFKPFLKYTVAALGSGGVMYFLLKFFDRSVWVKRLSFLGQLEGVRGLPFEKFVLDTRFTINLLILTILVALIGTIIYIGISIILRTKEVWTFFNLAKRVLIRHKVGPVPAKEEEPVAPTPTDTAN
jgi:putative peptidoglycan lipid II flippase